MPKPRARCATSWPMRPKPTTPSVFSYSSTPENFERSHLPSISDAYACGMLRASASSSAIVCSAAVTTLDSGALATTIPRLRRGRDVDVVDAHAGAADHLQARRRARSARRSSSSPSGSGCRRSRRSARPAPHRSSRCRDRRRSARAAAPTPESPIFSLTSTFGRRRASAVARRSSSPILSTTQSMQRGQRLHVGGLDRGEHADPQLVAPELAVGLDVDDAVRAQRRRDRGGVDGARRSRSCRRPASACAGSATNGVV